ncbi:vacuolar ATPase assembly integral membrane protein vma21 [Purpureocillium takamizusanense]|uniref:Vacuolar ATPase assembly integral membrane protein vma21 n=1 Tax=Purpureocillium takamizusanense TaxID=2060973 RepID=A0A9Q8Q8T9_9HYPO|nr:vacuolar ATPase assembly integral membrane protein vma21 [Purpureocillium takamizusanense]UNI15165.1 vacuolar ATPase assembly integral membrane protein vma21 [Purpureocillium takamizusanense]
MATRRIVSSEKTILEKDDHGEEKSNISPVVPTHVILKLLGFTLAMIVVPIGSYFLTVDTVFKGNSSYAGGLAALLANAVLVAYVVVAMKEDQSELNAASRQETKKDR